MSCQATGELLSKAIFPNALRAGCCVDDCANHLSWPRCLEAGVRTTGSRSRSASGGSGNGDSRPTTLLLAGVKDELVPVFHSRNIQSAFEEAGVTSKLIEFKDAGHGFGGEDAENATKAMVAWFEKHLAQQAFRNDS